MALPNSGLEPAGVELVVKSQAQFTDAINRATAVVDKFNASTSAAANNSRSTNQAFGGLSIGSIALGSALGAFLVSGINKVIDGFKQLAVGAVSSAIEFERTRVAFTSMLGSAEEARYLLSEITKLALKSPFKIPDLETAAARLIGVGDATENVIHDMTILGNAASALNVPIERLILNFGQTITQQKLTGRELRDFALAGIPLLQEIAKNLQLTTSEVSKMVSAGQIGLEDVRHAFETLSAEGGRFHDMMQSQSLTTSGRINMMANQLTILGRTFGSILMPSVNAVISIFQRFLSMIGPGGSLERPMLAFIALIDVLASAFASLGQRALNALDRFAPTIENKIFPVIRDALVWGAQFSANFAKGIIEGAARALTYAIQFVSSMLSYFFKPGSPPRVAPEIDAWGAAAFTEYLRGFTKADFSILSDLQSPIKSALDFFVQAQELGQGDANEIFRNISEDIAAAIANVSAGGEIDVSFISRYAEYLGEASGEIQKLLNLELQLVGVNKALEDSEAALETAQEARVEAATRYNEEQQKLALMRNTRAPAAEIIAQEKVVKSAAEQVTLTQRQETEAQKVVDAKEEELALVQEQVDVQKQLVQQLISLNATRINPLEQMIEGIDKMTEGLETVADSMAELSNLPAAEFTFEIDPDVYKGIKDSIIDLLDDIKSPFEKAWQDLWGGVTSKTVTTAEGFTFETLAFDPGPLSELSTAVDTLRETFSKIADNPGVQGFMNIFSAESTARIASWAGMILVALSIVAGVASVFAAIAGGVGVVIAFLASTPALVVAAVVAIIAGIVVFWDEIVEFFSGIWTWLVETDANLKRWGAGLVAGIIQWFVDVWNGFSTTIAGWADGAAGWANDLLGGFLDGLVTTWENVKQWFVDAWNGIVDWVKGFLGISSPSTLFMDFGKNLVQGFLDGLKAIWDTVTTWFSGALDGLVALVTDVVGGIVDTIASIFGGGEGEATRHTASKNGEKTSADGETIPAPNIEPALTAFTQLNAAANETLLMLQTWSASSMLIISTWVTGAYGLFQQWHGQISGMFLEHSAFIQGIYLTALNQISEFISTNLFDSAVKLTDYFNSSLRPAFGAIIDVVRVLLRNLKELAEAMQDIKVPPVLMPGSPTPFEMGLRGINSQLDGTVSSLKRLNSTLKTAMKVQGAAYAFSSGGGGVTNNERNINISMSPNYVNAQSPSSILGDLYTALAIVGV